MQVRAERELEEAHRRLNVATDPIERGRAQIEVTLTAGARSRAARGVAAAELMARRCELEAECEAFKPTILDVYPVAAKVIMGAMATSWRLQQIIHQAESRGARVPRLFLPLLSPEFCAALRLINLSPRGLNGFLWYPSSPEEIKKIKERDAVDLLSAIRPSSFIAGGVEAETSAKAANEAAHHLFVLYEHAARKIAELLRGEQQLEEKLELWKDAARFQLWSSIRPATPLERLAGRKTLWNLTVLPAADGRGTPIWASPRGYALAGDVRRHPADVIVR